MKMTREQFKNIVKEVLSEEAEYQEFFKKALEKTGKSIPDMSDEEKKAFFNKIDAAWQGKGEKNEDLVGNQHKLDIDGDGEIEASDLAALRAGKKVDESVEEASTISAPGEWVAYLSMTRGKKLLKTFNTARGAKQFLSKNVDKLLGGSNVESVGIMTKKQWDEREAKYAIEGVNEVSSKEKEIYAKIEKLRVLSNSGKITGDEFLDKFMPLWKQLKGMKSESVNEGKKRFKQQDGVGSSKYTISYHDGKKKHKDGSDFFDIKIFKNKPELEAFKKDLVSKGFVSESVNEIIKTYKPGDGEEVAKIYSGHLKGDERYSHALTVVDILHANGLVTKPVAKKMEQELANSLARLRRAKELK